MVETTEVPQTCLQLRRAAGPNAQLTRHLDLFELERGVLPEIQQRGSIIILLSEDRASSWSWSWSLAKPNPTALTGGAATLTLFPPRRLLSVAPAKTICLLNS